MLIYATIGVADRNGQSRPRGPRTIQLVRLVKWIALEYSCLHAQIM